MFTSLSWMPEVEYELWVPLGAEVKIQSASGSIQVRRRDNDIWAKTVSGIIELEDIRGDMETKTISGAVYINDSKGTIISHSVSARIQIDEVQGDMVLDTTSGKITSEFEMVLEGASEKRELQGTINEGDTIIILKTTSGDISLRKLR